MGDNTGDSRALLEKEIEVLQLSCKFTDEDIRRNGGWFTPKDIGGHRNILLILADKFNCINIKYTANPSMINTSCLFTVPAPSTRVSAVKVAE